MSNQTIDRIVEVMNEALALDRDAVSALVAHRVPCNDQLGDHATIQCGGSPVSVGLLGILNGIGGIREDGYGHITAVMSDNDQIVGFERTDDAAVSCWTGRTTEDEYAAVKEAERCACGKTRSEHTAAMLDHIFLTPEEHLKGSATAPHDPEGPMSREDIRK